MKTNSIKTTHIKKAAISMTLTQLLLSSPLALANDKQDQPQRVNSIVTATSFELIDGGCKLAGGDTNYVCGNNYGCV